VSSPRERFLAFRQSVGRAPRLQRRDVRVRGLHFAVWTSPAVEGAVPLCCVNGGLLYDHGILWPALSPLAARRQLVLYDQRGRGATAAPPGARAARIEHDAGDLAALRGALDIDQWDVLGHSWGGGIAMLGALDDLEGIRRLVLVDPAGAASEWLETLHDAGLARLRERGASAFERLRAYDPAVLREPNPAVHSEYARAFYPAWFADAELGAMFLPPRSTSLTGAAVAARLRREGYDWRDRLRALSLPSLVLHGEQDVLPAAQSRRTIALLPHARFELLADAGHLPFLEAADRFFPLVDAFLEAPAHAPSSSVPSSPR
jgi:proline iminopeptidase